MLKFKYQYPYRKWNKTKERTFCGRSYETSTPLGEFDYFTALTIEPYFHRDNHGFRVVLKWGKNESIKDV